MEISIKLRLSWGNQGPTDGQIKSHRYHAIRQLRLVCCTLT